MITVHLIFNAHLDPIWLWPWQSGLDEALATCRSACDRLDAHSDLTFTRGEAWVYEQIEQVDPELFDRIMGHVRAGRWAITGGWYIQPDCNLPSGFGFQKQIELGKRYFLDKFGFFPRAAYNVDSFGHAATLPGYMRCAGQDRYVMMRPQEHEMALPGRLFRWRGYDDGPEVVTFRIAGAYTTVGSVTLEHIRESLTELPDGIDHTMCFVGVGDHGGGPTEESIAWCRKHADAIDGARLVFSTADRFFDAIEGQHDRLPVVTGELQMHAIGCYTVHRPIKCGLRQAEHMLAQAEVAIEKDPAPPADAAESLDRGWRQVCFHHFHDTLGGTCLPSAFRQVDDELGMSRAIADQTMHYSLRRQIAALSDDPLQRIVAFNASDQPFDGYVEFEPWLDWCPWQQGWRLLDEHDEPVAYQILDSEAQVDGLTRLLFQLGAEPGAIRSLRIDTNSQEPEQPGRVTADAQRIANDTGVVLDLVDAGRMCVGAAAVEPGRLELLDDRSDTWSHDIDRYAGEPVASASFDAPLVIDSGPLMASLLRVGHIGRSILQTEYRVYADAGFVELKLRVHWAEQFKLLKLTFELPAAATERIDGISGGELVRACDGKERPLRDRTLLRLADGNSLGVVCPDVFALDGDEHQVRLTLLRSPLMAWHEPNSGSGARQSFADQGVHEFSFRFFAGDDVTGELLDRHAMMMQRPLVVADLTRGMPKRPART